MDQNRGNAKTIIVVIVAIVGLLFIAGIGQALKDKKTATTPVEPTSQVQKVENTSTPTEQPTNQTLLLNHDSLFTISKENPNSVIGKIYDMTLYLEQAPTTTDAYFMSQLDPNSSDNILVLCYMNSNELNKLDGSSAQKGVYKPYDLKITFSKYDNQVGLGYEAQCVLK